MSKDEWFRRTSWSASDQAEFFARLKRSRSRYNKAQYLRIQASHLAETSVESQLQAALQLLDQMIAEYPDATTQLAIAHCQRAACFADLGEYDAAIEEYRKALEVQLAHPHSLTTAHTAFAELVVTLDRRALFPEVLSALDKYDYLDIFPVDVFKGQAARALIAADRGDLVVAQTHAKRALEAASATESGFRYHKTLGLVGFVDPKLTDRLRELSAA